MKSDKMKSGVERTPQRSLLKAMGYTDSAIKKPLIGIVNSYNEVVPGHIHLNRIARSVKDGVLSAGGTPMEFNTIAVCDGLAMGHTGMKYSLCSRELIADSIESVSYPPLPSSGSSTAHEKIPTVMVLQLASFISLISSSQIPSYSIHCSGL